MNRRTLLTTAMVGTGFFLGPHAGAKGIHAKFPSASDADAYELILTLADNSFTIAPSLSAGRYNVTVTNSGASMNAHTVVARVPDQYTQDDFIAIMNAADNKGFDFNTLRGAGFPDWPLPGGSVTGVADLFPGLYVIFDPVSSRGYAFTTVTGPMPDVATPTADLDFAIGEMLINLPKGPIKAGTARWHISNVGAMIHELAVLEVPAGFTFDDFMALMMLPEDATPTPDMKVVEYQPVAAIGLLGSQTESWLDVDLAGSKHYMAVCMFPDAQGVPHAMAGMYAFFDIA